MGVLQPSGTLKKDYTDILDSHQDVLIGSAEVELNSLDTLIISICRNKDI